ncbi:MAG: nicotinate (nicotinamide) nucleotide adenylyltransferase [Bdellovibrionia bacterium]
MGHINSVATVAEKLKLKKVLVVPSLQTPGKETVESPSADDRVEMAKLAFADDKKIVEVDSREIKRGGVSYTIDTLKDLAQDYDSEQLHLIIGADAFEHFDRWKDFEKILGLVNLVVTTRPGFILPYKIQDLPQGIQPLAESMEQDEVILSTGRTIQFVHLKDVGISATELRKFIRSGLKVDKYMPMLVEKYVRAKKLYSVETTGVTDFKKLTEFCAGILFDKKGFNVRGFDLSSVESPTDFTLIASGTSTRHVSSLGENVVAEVKRKFGMSPLSTEGVREGRWVLVDYGALIVHIFYDFIRQEYKLEELWSGGKQIPLEDQSAAQRLAKSAE